MLVKISATGAPVDVDSLTVIRFMRIGDKFCSLWQNLSEAAMQNRQTKGLKDNW